MTVEEEFQLAVLQQHLNDEANWLGLGHEPFPRPQEDSSTLD